MIVGPCSDGVAIMGYGTNSGIRGPDVAQRRISVVTELGDGPLSDVGFKRNFVLKVSTYLHIVGIRIAGGVDARSLVGIFDGGIVATGYVGYGVGSALKGSIYERHIAYM